MNKKVIKPIIIIIALALLAAALLYAPNILDAVLRAHGIR